MRKKVLMLAIALFVGVVGMPTVFADYDGSSVGSVKEYSGKDSIGTSNVENVVNARDPKNVVITYNALNLKEVDKSQTDGASIDAAWVGFHIDLPNTAEQAKSKFKVDAGEYQAIDPDGNYYTSITLEKLKNAYDSGQPIKVVYYFDYNEDSQEDQTVTVIIDPAKVVFTAKDSEEPAFNGPEKEAAKNAVDKPAVQPAEKAEENPNTADINIYALLGLMFVSGCGLAFVAKKRFN